MKDARAGKWLEGLKKYRLAALAALLESGIAATKAPGDEGTWNVMIGEKDFAEAATLCERRGTSPGESPP